MLYMCARCSIRIHFFFNIPTLCPPGHWANMDVAVKIMLFQNSTQLVPAPHSAAEDPNNSARKRMDTRQLVLREAAVCCSMSHPNVVATYHYEVLQATAFRDTPSGLSITDRSGEEAFKLYLLQVGKPNFSQGASLILLISQAYTLHTP